MEIYKLYIDLLQNPFSVKNYRALEQYYTQQDKLREAKAFSDLIALRFQNATNNSDPLRERPRHD